MNAGKVGLGSSSRSALIDQRSGGPAIRIAMVHSFYSSAQPSGENTVVRNEVDALRRAGHEVALFAAHTDELEGEVFYKLRSGMRVATGYGRNPLKAIQDFSPDVVHVHNLFPNYGCNWLADLGRPVVATVHNYRRVCVQGSLFRDGKLCTDCLEGSTLSAVINKCYRNSAISSAALAGSPEARDTVKSSLRIAARVIFYSDHALRAHSPTRDTPEKFTVWPQFIPAGEVPSAERLNESIRKGWVFAGRISEEKGLVELLRRWPRGHPLTVIGDGPLLSAAKATVEGRPDVRFTGRLASGAVTREFSRHIGMVFPSVRYAMFGRVHAESLACGLPILAFAPSPAAAIAKRDRVGVEARWEDDLPETLSRAARDMPGMHDRCAEVFRERHTESKYAQRATKLYEAVTA
jgi:glycosyltransferase involved in cell wall biosynthesis